MGFKHTIHLFNPCKYIIKTIGCPCMCLRRGLCSVLRSECEMVYFLFCVPTLFINIVSWDLRDTNRWSRDMGFAPGHCLSTNWIIPWHHGKTLGIFTLALVIKAMIMLGNGKISLVFLFVMHLVKRW